MKGLLCVCVHESSRASFRMNDNLRHSLRPAAWLRAKLNFIMCRQRSLLAHNSSSSTIFSHAIKNAPEWTAACFFSPFAARRLRPVRYVLLVSWRRGWPLICLLFGSLLSLSFTTLNIPHICRLCCPLPRSAAVPWFC